jgi:hypothetical protein
MTVPSDISTRSHDNGRLVRFRLNELSGQRLTSLSGDRTSQGGTMMEIHDPVGPSRRARPVHGRIAGPSLLVLPTNLAERPPQRASQLLHA